MHFLALSKLMLTRAVRSWRLIQLERGTANIGKQHLLHELSTDALAKQTTTERKRKERKRKREDREITRERKKKREGKMNPCAARR